MHPRKRLIVSCLAGWLLIHLICVSSALADGCILPPIETAQSKAPDIPLQRAVMVYKDQVERLIIESSIRGEGQRFGWIVPVPALPADVAKASPGLLSTLSMRTRPQAFDNLSGLIIGLSIPAVMVICWAASVIKTNPPTRKGVLDMAGSMVWAMLIVFVVYLLGSSMLLGSGGDMSAGATTGIDVWQSRIVGNYDVTTLQADTPKALNRWLDENGFAPFPAKAVPVLDDYIANGWCFVAARLQRSGDGVLRPHPLSITFASPEPVYPMRLTALSGEPVHLELFVVAEQRAHCDQLQCDASGVLRQEDAPTWILHREGPVYTNRTLLGFSGLVDIHDILWDGCCLTRLSADLDPEDMRADFVIRWDEPGSHRRLLFSHKGAGMAGICVAEIVLMLGIPVALFGIAGRFAQDQRRRAYLVRGMMPVLGVTLLSTAAVYLVLPKTGVQAERWAAAAQVPSLDEALKAVSHAQPASETSLLQLREGVAEYFHTNGTLNAFSLARIVEEDSPGNYTLEEQDEGFLMRWYWWDMSNCEVFVPRDPGEYQDRRQDTSWPNWRVVWQPPQ